MLLPALAAKMGLVVKVWVAMVVDTLRGVGEKLLSVHGRGRSRSATGCREKVVTGKIHLEVAGETKCSRCHVKEAQGSGRPLR